MYATIRRYDGVDQNRTDEVTRNVGEKLIPRLSKLPGFGGYFLIGADNGVMSSISFFDAPEQSEESTRVAANWVRDEKLETALPNAPKVTGGNVVAHELTGMKA